MIVWTCTTSEMHEMHMHTYMCVITWWSSRTWYVQCNGLGCPDEKGKSLLDHLDEVSQPRYERTGIVPLLTSISRSHIQSNNRQTNGESICHAAYIGISHVLGLGYHASKPRVVSLRCESVSANGTASQRTIFDGSMEHSDNLTPAVFAAGAQALGHLVHPVLPVSFHGLKNQ